MISFEQLPESALLDRLKGSEMEEASDGTFGGHQGLDNNVQPIATLD